MKEDTKVSVSTMPEDGQQKTLPTAGNNWHVLLGIVWNCLKRNQSPL